MVVTISYGSYHFLRQLPFLTLVTISYASYHFLTSSLYLNLFCYKTQPVSERNTLMHMV
jgi:hypothetical protein